MCDAVRAHPCGGISRALLPQNAERLPPLDHSDKVIEHTEQVGQYLYGKQGGDDSQAGDNHDGDGVASLLFKSDLG